MKATDLVKTHTAAAAAVIGSESRPVDEAIWHLAAAIDKLAEHMDDETTHTGRLA